MPGIDGLALAERIAQRPELAEACILLLPAAHRSCDSRRQAILDSTICLTKPFGETDLESAIFQTLDLKATTREQDRKGQRDRKLQSTQCVLCECCWSKTTLSIKKSRSSNWRQWATVSLLLAAAARLWNCWSVNRSTWRSWTCRCPAWTGSKRRAHPRARRQTSRRLPIIAVTARAAKSDRDRCLQAGMDGHVAKPIQDEKLRRPSAKPCPNAEFPWTSERRRFGQRD